MGDLQTIVMFSQHMPQVYHFVKPGKCVPLPSGNYFSDI